MDKIKSKFRRYAYYYCILPNGNESEFPLIDAELIRQGVTAHRHNFSSGGAVYRVHRRDIDKLPVWNREPYLAVEPESGHGIYHMSDAALSSLLLMPYKPYRQKEYKWEVVK